jgi:hypothetical protein
MGNLLKTPGRTVGAILGAGLLNAAMGATVARPGTVNYAEGQVNLEGRTLGAKSLGSTEVAPGKVLQTERGKAEMLLTPGVFLRVGDNSAVRMVSPSLTDTRVELLRGRAMVEVAQIEKENRLEILDNGAATRLTKRGVYAFDADHPAVAVYDGKATVREDDRTVDVGKGKRLDLQPAAELKPVKFDKNEPDPLYQWSKLRSRYLAQANQSSAEVIVANSPGWYYGTGWYWNPWFDTWAFVPGSGLLYSPFGYGFYSPTYFAYYPPAYYYSRPGRIWHGGGGSRTGSGVTNQPAAHPPAAGGSGIRFGGGAPASAPAARPSPAPAPAPMRAAPPAAGGSGVRFGGRGR